MKKKTTGRFADSLPDIVGALRHANIREGVVAHVAAALVEADKVVVHCEGCSATYRVTFTKRGRWSSTSAPRGWSGCGRSRKHPGRIAEWCPKCRSKRQAVAKQRERV